MWRVSTSGHTVSSCSGEQRPRKLSEREEAWRHSSKQSSSWSGGLRMTTSSLDREEVYNTCSDHFEGDPIMVRFAPDANLRNSPAVYSRLASGVIRAASSVSWNNTPAGESWTSCSRDPPSGGEHLSSAAFMCARWRSLCPGTPYVAGLANRWALRRDGHWVPLCMPLFKGQTTPNKTHNREWQTHTE